MDFNLSQQELMLQKEARAFARKEVLPQAAEIDRTGEFPLTLAKEMGRLGFFGLPYPADCGGIGAGYLGYVLVVEQLAQASMSVGAIVAVSILPQESLFRFGNKEQKRKILTSLTKCDKFGCFCFTEPSTGSDPKAIATTARPAGDCYIISGEKTFISVSPVASTGIIFAKDDTNRVTAFVADTADPGFVVGEVCDTMGLRGLGSSTVYFNDMEISSKNILGKKGEGYEVLLEAISMERMGVAAQSVGIAQAALDLSVAYAQQRMAYEKPISRMPTIQWLLAEMCSKIEAGRWLTYQTAFQRDQGRSVRKDSAVAKLFCSQMASAVTKMAMQVHGSYGAMRTLPVERMYRDAKMTELYVGVSEIQRAIIADHLIRGERE